MAATEVDVFSDIINTAADGVDLTSSGGDNLFIAAGVTVAGENGFDGVNASETGKLVATIDGAVFGSDFGIVVSAASSSFITVASSGNVTGGDGIEITSGSGASSITNGGTISGVFGIIEQGTAATIQNSGTIEALGGSNSAAVQFDDSGAITDSITNSGLVEGVFGIQQTGGNIMAVNNSGTVTAVTSGVVFDDVTSGTTDTLHNSGTISNTRDTGANDSAVLEKGAATLDLANSGTLQSAATAILDSGAGNMSIGNDAGGTIAGTAGIQFDGASGTHDDLTNAGAIDATGQQFVFPSGGPGDAVFEDGSASLVVINEASGTISGTIGIASLSGPTHLDTVTNYGTISGTALGILGNAGGLSLVNAGTVSSQDGPAVEYATQSGNTDTLISEGTIVCTSTSPAIWEHGAGFLDITNSGTVLTDTASGVFAVAIEGNQGGMTVDNQAGGAISGGIGIQFEATAPGEDFLDNDGTIHGTYNAVDLGSSAGSLSLKNDGSMSGVVAIYLEGASGASNMLVNEGTIHGTDNAIWETTAAQLGVTNSGDISGGTGAILGGAGGMIVDNEAGGAISGANGIRFHGASPGEDVLDNDGTIHATNIAVNELSNSGNLSVTNDGNIASITGIAIQFDGASGATDTLVNDGTIHGVTDAVDEAGAAALDIVNSGHIGGGIAFGAANDVYDGSLGNVTGLVNGGAGNDVLTGGAGADNLNGLTGSDVLTGNSGNDILTPWSGNDTVDGGDGKDTIVMGSFLTAADAIDGGDGYDTVTLAGTYTGATAVVFADTTLVNVEAITLTAGYSYTLTSADATVAAGASLTVDASTLASNKVLTFDGSAETDGHFNITGGAGADVITGGDMSDTLTGGAGADTFVYLDASESTSTQFDKLVGFDMTGDKLNLDVTVTAIDATVASGKLTTAGFDANLATAVSAAHLAAGHAVLFEPTLGNLKGDVFLIVDANGVAGYQAGQDYVFEIVNGAHLTSLSTTTFT